MSVLLIKVFVCWSVIINLTWASKECTAGTPWNCDHGGVNITIDYVTITRALERKRGIGREFEMREIERRLKIMSHKEQEIPEFFDSRIKWPMCRSISRIQNQGKCGTCWAFVSTMTTTDRLCIATKGRLQYDFSQQDMITCCKECYSGQSYSRCKTPASLVAPLMYVIKYGVGDAKCKPYDTTQLEDGCKKSCEKKNLSYKKQTFNMSFIVVGLVDINQPTSTIEDIQIEIMKYGPVSGRLDYTPDSFDREYKNGVYINPDSNPQDAGHAIKVIGWGIEKNVPYWLCANSWGTEWGELGFFKIRRGTNELGVEKLFIAADTDPENRPKIVFHIQDQSTKRSDVSSAISFTKILQIYKITIIVVNVLNS